MRLRHNDPFLLAIQKSTWEACRAACAKEAEDSGYVDGPGIAAVIRHVPFPADVHVPSGEALTPAEEAINKGLGRG